MQLLLGPRTASRARCTAHGVTSCLVTRSNQETRQDVPSWISLRLPLFKANQEIDINVFCVVLQGSHHERQICQSKRSCGVPQGIKSPWFTFLIRSFLIEKECLQCQNEKTITFVIVSYGNIPFLTEREYWVRRNGSTKSIPISNAAWIRTQTSRRTRRELQKNPSRAQHPRLASKDGILS